MSELRLASLATDGWQLRSGEDVHRAHPDTFWLPEAHERRTLARGMQAKLMFEMLEPAPAGYITTGVNRPLAAEHGDEPKTFVERMWVAITEIRDGRYLGMLRNQPFTYDPNDESVYLRWGAEVAFGPEHVIDIDDTPAEEDTLTGFTRRWT